MAEDTSAPRRWRQGIWTSHDQLIVLGFLVWQALARGTDYLQGLGPMSADYLILANAFGQWGFGLAFIVPACMVVTGITFNLHGIAWLGHALLAVVYAGIGMTLLTLLWIFWWPWWTLAFAGLVGIVVYIGSRNTPETRIGPWTVMVVLAVSITVLLFIPEMSERGVRAPGFYISMAIFHLLWAVRMGVTPLVEPTEAETTVVK